MQSSTKKLTNIRNIIWSDHKTSLPFRNQMEPVQQLFSNSEEPEEGLDCHQFQQLVRNGSGQIFEGGARVAFPLRHQSPSDSDDDASEPQVVAVIPIKSQIANEEERKEYPIHFNLEIAEE